MKKLRLTVICIVTLLITVQQGWAQKLSKESQKTLKEANLAYDGEEYLIALPLFLQVYKEIPADPELNFKIGKCYHEGNHETVALTYLEKSKKGDWDDPELLYLLGHAYHKAHKFDQAIAYFNQYKSLLDPKKNPDEYNEIPQLIQYCKNGKEMVAKPKSKIRIVNLGKEINSQYIEHTPVISADESLLIFTSCRETNIGGEKSDVTGYYYEDLYTSVKSDTSWSTAVNMGTIVNTNKADATVGLSADGHELLIYRDDGHNNGDLFRSVLTGTVWSEPKPFGHTVNTHHREPHGSITADDKVLFFVSDRPGGFGGLDIYMSKRLENGDFGPAKNLGPKVNTKSDEHGTFIHADGKTLYFSSRGHKSMGGYDIFQTTINVETGEILSEVENVGYPINTADDDVFFVWTADNKRAYFASEREGGFGETDIYMLIREDADADLAVLKGTILSCEGKQPVAATIIVTDLATGKAIGVYNSNTSTGKYTVILPAGKNYGITVEAPHYLFYSKNIDIPKLDHYVEIKDEICLDRLKKGGKIVLRNVFFDVDKATLRKESEDELERLHKILDLNPHMQIEIDGHTDSDGGDDHNLKLSEGRAKAVVDYLISKGVPKGNLTWKGYGETQPQVPNDTPENKQLNRRTEIKIIEE